MPIIGLIDELPILKPQLGPGSWDVTHSSWDTTIKELGQLEIIPMENQID